MTGLPDDIGALFTQICYNPTWSACPVQESEQERAILQATANAFNSAGPGPTHSAKPPKRARKPKSGNGSGSGSVDNGETQVTLPSLAVTAGWLAGVMHRHD